MKNELEVPEVRDKGKKDHEYPSMPEGGKSEVRTKTSLVFVESLQ